MTRVTWRRRPAGNYTFAAYPYSGGVMLLDGRGTLLFPSLQTAGNSIISTLGLTFYVVDSSTAVVLENDWNQSSTGALESQSRQDGATPGRAHFMARPPVSRAAASTGTIKAASGGVR
jgi:hypothetical protein